MSNKNYVCPVCEIETIALLCPECKKKGKLIPTFDKQHYYESKRKYKQYYE